MAEIHWGLLVWGITKYFLFSRYKNRYNFINIIELHKHKSPL